MTKFGIFNENCSVFTKYGNFRQFWGPKSSFDKIFEFFGYENGGVGEKIMLLSSLVQKLLSIEVMPIYGQCPNMGIWKLSVSQPLNEIEA